MCNLLMLLQPISNEWWWLGGGVIRQCSAGYKAAIGHLVSFEKAVL